MVHNGLMRTSITLDEDVYQHATLYARGRGVTLSTAVSEIARKGLEAMHSTSPSLRLKRAPNGLLIFAGTGRTITPEMVKEFQEDEIE
jgi:Arc/MetJ family transcription regulator